MPEFKSARMTDSTPANTIDDNVQALEDALCDLLGITKDVVTDQAAEITQAGIITMMRDLVMGAGKNFSTNDLTVAGDATFGGLVTLNADPTAALEAATKQYVDNASGGVGVELGLFAGTAVSVPAGSGGTDLVLTSTTNLDQGSFKDGADNTKILLDNDGRWVLVQGCVQIQPAGAEVDKYIYISPHIVNGSSAGLWARAEAIYTGGNATNFTGYVKATAAGAYFQLRASSNLESNATSVQVISLALTRHLY